MPNESFPIDTAQIVALFMESVVYGIYLPTFFSCMRVLLMSQEGKFQLPRGMRLAMMIAALGMFIFGSLDVAFGLRHNIEAFVWFSEFQDPEETFQDISDWINVMKMGCYVAQTFIGDTILLIRCYVIWDRKWYVVLPSAVLLLAETVCGAMTIYLEATHARAEDGSGVLNSSSLVPFITSMLSLTLAMNVLTTGLIIWRIWRVRSKMSGFRQTTTSVYSDAEKNPLSRAIRVMIESGLIYTTAILILFGVYMASSNAQLGVSNAVVQIIGITFNLIIVSTAKAREDRQSTSRGATSAHTDNLHMISIQTEVTRDPPVFYRPHRLGRDSVYGKKDEVFVGPYAQ